MGVSISNISEKHISHNTEQVKNEEKSVSIFSETLNCIDKYTFDILKIPVKQLTHKIDENNESKLWSFIKGLGDVADFIFSTEGLLTMGATILALKGINKGAIRLGGKKGGIIAQNIIRCGFFGYGGLQIGKGIGTLINQESTNPEIRKAGEEIGTGALFLAGASKMKMRTKDALAARKNLTPEELKIQLEETAVKVFDEMNIPESARPKIEIIEGNESTGGCYIADSNTIRFNTKTYLDGTYKSIEEVVAHEAEHARLAILRSRLSETEAKQAVKEILLDKIINGESEKIILSDLAGNTSMMEPPKMSAKMKAEFAKFIEEDVLGENAYTYFNEFIANRICRCELNKGQKLITRINEIIDNNPDFVEQYGADGAKNILNDYVYSHLTRYYEFSRTKKGDLSRLDLPELNQAEKAEAVKSIKGDIESREGNVRNQYFKDSKSFEQYHLSSEEIEARNRAAEFEKTKLEAGKQTPETRRRIANLEFEIKYNEIGKNYYRLYTESLNNPNDIALKTELLKAEKEYKSMYYKRLDMNIELNYIYEFQYLPIIGQINDNK